MDVRAYVTYPDGDTLELILRDSGTGIVICDVLQNSIFRAWQCIGKQCTDANLVITNMQYLKKTIRLCIEIAKITMTMSD